MACMQSSLRLLFALVPLAASGCGGNEPAAPAATAPAARFTAIDTSIQSRLDKYAGVKLTTDLSVLSEAEKKMLRLFIDASDRVNAIYWQQAYGDPQPLLEGIGDAALRRFVEINFGPWDRIDGNKPFVMGIGPEVCEIRRRILRHRQTQSRAGSDVVLGRSDPASRSVVNQVFWAESLYEQSNHTA